MKLKKITLAFLFSLIIVPVIGQKELTNRAIWTDHEFTSDYVAAVRSMNDGEHFSALEGKKIVKYSYTDFEKPVATIYESNLPEGPAPSPQINPVWHLPPQFHSGVLHR